MPHKEKDYLGEERRKYLRLDSVFPVEFRLLTPDGKNFLSDVLQGFTNNVSKGGICLTVNNLKSEFATLIKSKQAKLSLGIEMPLTGKPTPALANVTWTKEVIGEVNRYFIGLSYEQIDPRQNNVIMQYAWSKKLFVPVVLSVIIILGVSLSINTFISYKLIKGNKALVTQLVNIVQESSVAKQKIKEISKDKEDLQLAIQALQLRLQSLGEEKAKLEEKAKSEEEKLKSEADKTGKKIEELNSLIDKLSQEKNTLQEKLIVTQRKENTVAEELLQLDKRRATLEEANFRKMYQWLKIHQNPHTGLVMSFEGDSNIANWAFTYDQSLLIQAYTIFSDFDRARKMLDFFNKKAERRERLFLNAYYANDGSPAEHVIHSGPNIWLGMAVLHYTKETQDSSYLDLAEDIAQGIINLQNQDSDGGIRGGPNVTWYATEHNLDAYAFFDMLHDITQKDKYAGARDKVLTWLVSNTYDKLEIPIMRGKGDSTIATDTYAWSIAAIGPEKLEEIGMNPDRIIEFAEQNCAVQVSFARPEGQTVKIKGFDFAPQRHVSRGGVVSSEWTAQMVMAFKIMADFYHQKGMIAKARAYEKKADEYLLELTSMLISSPSPSGQGEGCLPYATQDFVDTGHGWMTPKGKTTGSVAGTAYTLFAYYNYNPLKLKSD
jgi:hypothetical protein